MLVNLVFSAFGKRTPIDFKSIEPRSSLTNCNRDAVVDRPMLRVRHAYDVAFCPDINDAYYTSRASVFSTCEKKSPAPPARPALTVPFLCPLSQKRIVLLYKPPLASDIKLFEFYCGEALNPTIWG
ncbi:hypothetical protein EVAR_45605_1 [Eumeta japonica]|uniref:Uncharacterized protein n=1 Tax=Eumeta variegata TaxID=151549 RepID=A0A4C1WEI8_EUMVA|nr:hypothetical protein EVAR_45605_1 [Eumeta japonica]